MSIQELIEELPVELTRKNLGNIERPPLRIATAVMKADTAKLSRVGEDERPAALIQDEMIMLLRTKGRGRDP